MILDLMQIIIGLTLTIFLPGYLLSKIIFRRIYGVEAVVIGFGLNLSIIVGLAFALTIIKSIFGVLSFGSPVIWITLILLTFWFSFILYRRNHLVSSVQKE